MGVDHRLVWAEPVTATEPHCRQLRPSTATIQDPAKGDQRWVLPVRRQLLPSLPASRSPAPDDRYWHEPRRLPLHSPRFVTAVRPMVKCPVISKTFRDNV